MKVPPMTMPVMARFWGPFAAFNRPEFQSERVSYMVPTPSAIRGMLEAVYWKKEFHWRIREIWVLNTIRWYSETRNEVSTKATAASLHRPMVVDGQNSYRFQRHTLMLYDVNYVIVAETIPNKFSVEEMEKHTHIFNERIRRGQWHQQPYFGTRECSANYSPCDGTEKPISLSLNLGRMAFDQNYVTPGMSYASHNNDSKPIPVYYDAKLENGVIHVPDDLYDVCGGCRDDRTQPPPPPMCGV